MAWYGGKQQVHGGTPAYEVTRSAGSASHPTFACRLTAPAVHTPFGGFEEQVFIGNGRIKKAAEHAAAEMVLLPLVSALGSLQTADSSNTASVCGWQLMYLPQYDLFLWPCNSGRQQYVQHAPQVRALAATSLPMAGPA